MSRPLTALMNLPCPVCRARQGCWTVYVRLQVWWWWLHRPWRCAACGATLRLDGPYYHALWWSVVLAVSALFFFSFLKLSGLGDVVWDLPDPLDDAVKWAGGLAWFLGTQALCMRGLSIVPVDKR